MDLIARLNEIESRYDELSLALAQPDAYDDPDNAAALMKEQSRLMTIVTAWRRHNALQDEKKHCEAMLSDPELSELAQDELNELQTTIQTAWNDVLRLLIPSDPNDDRGVIIEVRPAAGGEEASLFAGLLVRMYSRYAERVGWKVELTDINETDLGGVKEATLMVSGTGAWRRLKFESGVHRIQRVPQTESSGRIHTSTATVAVLAEAEEAEIDINPNDLRVDVYRTGGHGGQSVNTTDSAVRITHIPTGVVVVCQDERSQLKNKYKAMRVLRSRLYDLKQGELDEKRTSARRGMVGTGDRSERIRTYNFPQGRVSDHRIDLTKYNIAAFMDGDMDEILDALAAADEAERIATLTDGE